MKIPTPYNSGIHKGRNLSLFLAGWGLWVMVFRPLGIHNSFDGFPQFAGGLLLGAFYVLMGLVSGRLIVGRFPRLGLSIMIGGYVSLAVFFAIECYSNAHQTGEYFRFWSTAIYTYGGLAFIGVTAIGDYIKGER